MLEQLSKLLKLLVINKPDNIIFYLVFLYSIVSYFSHKMNTIILRLVDHLLFIVVLYSGMVIISNPVENSNKYHVYVNNTSSHS